MFTYQYKIDSSFSTVNYYRSLESIDVNQLPAPEGVSTDLIYVDTTASLDTKYYVRFATVNSEGLAVSDEVYAYKASPHLNTEYLIADFKVPTYDWSSSSSDYGVLLTADASWSAADFLVVVIYSRSATISVVNAGFNLISTRQTSGGYIHVLSGIKGSLNALNFTLSTASGGSCFAAICHAISNVQSVDSVVYSDQAGLSFSGNIRLGNSDGLAAISFLASDVQAKTLTFPYANPTRIIGVNSNAVGWKTLQSYSQQLLEKVNKSRTFDFEVSSTLSTVLGSIFLKRKSGTRPTITYNVTELESALSVSKGYAYAVIKDGEVVYQKCMGVAMDGGDVITENTLFQIGSISKLITELAIRKLNEDNILSLDDKLSDHFSSGLGIGVANIKIRDLLSMKAGITYNYNLLNLDYEAETLNYLSNTASETGIKYSYNNACFSVLHLIVDKLTGSYVEYVQNSIFKKIGIYDATHDSSQLMMKMHHPTNGSSADLYNITATAAGGWCLSLKGLSKIAKALRYSVILNEQIGFKEDRYRMSPRNSSKGEYLQHDGALVNGTGIGVRAQYMMGADGYDVIALTNTYLSQSLVASATKVLEG